MKISMRDRVLGCLLGGACGDALGAPFEFSSHAEMIIECGPGGVQEF
jgi:ADP-ribosylglycohydrolase